MRTDTAARGERKKVPKKVQAQLRLNMQLLRVRLIKSNLRAQTAARLCTLRARQKRIALSDKSLQLSPSNIVRALANFDGAKKRFSPAAEPFGFLRRSEKVSEGLMFAIFQRAVCLQIDSFD